ncbi:MAG: MBL fold metallo-hydrolase [Chloroflexota bacterium]|nr:MAG: MBL fold metallo-hydrolase [Bellilinea sp.]
MNILKIRFKSTHCYFIESGSGLLAFDAGWPDTYKAYKDGLKEQGYSVKDIRWLMVSHFHMDHAGLAGILVHHGVQFVVFSNQRAAIADMEKLIERKNISYQKIDPTGITLMEIAQSRAWLAEIGIKGEVCHTNGHSEDSISLILDSGEAFIGDLVPREDMIGEEDWKSQRSWALIRSKGARCIKPAHAEEYEILDQEIPIHERKH